MTDKHMMELKNIDKEAIQDIVCDYCNLYIIRNRPPSFMCEGRFCEEAWERWLEEEQENLSNLCKQGAS